MTDQALLLERVSRRSVDAWLALGASRSRDAYDAVLADIAENPRRERFVLRDSLGPAGGFAIEFGEAGATTWTPRVRSGLSGQEALQIYGETIHHLVSLGARSGMRYIECTLKDGTTREIAWKSALTRNQFQLVATKCEWVKWCGRPLPSDTRFRIWRAPTESPIVTTLYRHSIMGSRDRTTVYDSRNGSGLGAADLVLIARVGRVDAALCACLHEPGAVEAWIKYVGTVPRFRRSGVARSLLAETIGRLSRTGVKRVRCLIDTRNRPSLALHRALGFEQKGACGDFYYRKLKQNP